MMWKQSTSISVIITLAAYGVSAQVVTFSGKLEQKITCDVSSASAAQWNENLDNGTNIPLFALSDGQVQSVKPQLGKYDDFSATLESDTFILIIQTVEKDDSGTYACVRIGPPALLVELEVEVPPTSTAVTCSICTRTDSADPSCNCQCSASGGSSPSILRLEWKIQDSGISQPPTENSTTEGQIVYTSNAVVSVSEAPSVVTCTVTGFVNQAEIAVQFRSRVEAEQTLSSPVCNVSVSSDNCPNVELRCSCDAYPSVPNSPDHTSYYSRQGTENTGSDILLNDTSQVVTPGSNTYFVCTGDNGLGVSTKSAAVPNPCKENTTPTPTKADVTKPTPASVNALAIALPCCIVGIIGIVAGGFLAYHCCYKNRGDKKGNNDNTGGNGVNAKLAEEQPEYAAVNKPKSQPQAAPRSSQPPDYNEQMELQYADLDHGNRGRTNEIHQPADEPTQYAEVKSVIV